MDAKRGSAVHSMLKVCARAVLVGWSLLFALTAAAEPPATAVRGAWPLVPIHSGASMAEIGFEVDGPVSQLLVSATGTAGTSTEFVKLTELAVARDYAGAVPFHLLVPFKTAFPANGVLELSVTSVSATGVLSSPFVTRFDAKAGPPSFGKVPVVVHADSHLGGISLEVNYSGQVASAEVSLIGASAQIGRAHV